MTHPAIITVEDGLKSSAAMIEKQPSYLGGEFTFEAPANHEKKQNGTSNAPTPTPTPTKPKTKRGEKAEVARRELSALSRHLKGQRDLRMAVSTSEAECEALAMMSTNDLLIEHYQRKTGASVFHKFKDWKEKGFSVQKGETAFRVWAAPTRDKKHGEVVRHDGTREETESSFEFFPMCCLFSDLQVAPIESAKEE